MRCYYKNKKEFSNETYNNCAECNSENCTVCKDGYYLVTDNNKQECKLCNETYEEGCLKCDTSQCLECGDGYFINDTVCSCIDFL